MEKAVFLGEFCGNMSASDKNTLSEQALQSEWQEIEAAKANPARFGKLYDRYYEPVFRYIYKRTADEEMAADITSQVFLKAMQSLHKYEFKGLPFAAWLLRIAGNETYQYFRIEGRRRVVTIEDRHIHDLEEEFEDREQLDINVATLKAAIQELPPEDVDIIELRFFEQRPFKEVADILDISESNAKIRLHRLIPRLRELFLKKQTEEE